MAFVHKKNNFDSLRLLAATTVLLSHQFALMGLPEPKPFPDTTWGTLSVMVFFVISGYWVTQSWMADPHLGRFVSRRLLRLLPGLCFVVLISLFVLGPIVTDLSLSDYFSSGKTWRYLNNIRLAIVYELPGVFVGNPYPRIVNGSLWTLPVEARWYLVVAGTGLLGFMRFKHALLLAWIMGAWFYGRQISPDGLQHPDVFWTFGIFFLAGMRLSISKLPHQIVILLGVVALFSFYLGAWFFGLAIALPLLVTVIGLSAFPFLKEVGRLGDLSYGVYIFAFPVQQTVIRFLGPTMTHAPLLLISLVVTYALAFVSWHAVESPALQLKRKLQSTKKSPI